MRRADKILSSLSRKWSFSVSGAFRMWVTGLKMLELVIACSLILGGTLWLLQLLPEFDYTIRQMIPHSSRRVACIAGLMHLSVLITLWTLFIALLLGSVMRMFYVTRFVYKLIGSVGKLVLFWLPFVVLQGWLLEHYWPQISWKAGALLGIIPAGILFHSCISLTDACLPELLPLAKKTAGLLKEGAPKETWTWRKKPEKVKPPTEEELFAEILGLKGDYNFEQVKKQYYLKARQYHPDKVLHLGSRLREAAENEMKEINRAYAFFEKKMKKK
jgi:hypothetical protein